MGTASRGWGMMALHEPATMKRSGMTGQRLTAIFMMGCVLLNYPILFLFSRATHVAAVPLLYWYVFGAWAVLIALMTWVIERPRT